MAPVAARRKSYERLSEIEGRGGSLCCLVGLCVFNKCRGTEEAAAWSAFRTSA